MTAAPEHLVGSKLTLVGTRYSTLSMKWTEHETDYELTREKVRDKLLDKTGTTPMEVVEVLVLRRAVLKVEAVTTQEEGGDDGGDEA